MEATGPTDAELMAAYGAGDQAAFARLYGRHRGVLYRYFRRQLPNDQADDCFQALWLKIIDHAPRYRPAAPFERYLFTLAHNVLMDHHRKEQRRRRRLAPAADDPESAAAEPADGAMAVSDGAAAVTAAADPETAAAVDQLRRRLQTLLGRLPFHQREAWILRQEAGMSMAEIAAITATSIEGVKSRLRYATDKLKAGMTRYV